MLSTLDAFLIGCLVGGVIVFYALARFSRQLVETILDVLRTVQSDEKEEESGKTEEEDG